MSAEEQPVYTVTIRTTCRACAMALAGHAPGLRTIRAVFVSAPEPKEGGVARTIHGNSPGLVSHDGTPLACTEHGVVMDLSSCPCRGQEKRGT